MNETKITNVFHVDVNGHHNAVDISQNFETTNTGGDVGKVLQIVLGFVAMILLSPVWIPYLLLTGSSAGSLTGGDDDDE